MSPSKKALLGVAFQGLGFALATGVRGSPPILSRGPETVHRLVAAILVVVAVLALALVIAAMWQLGPQWSVRARTITCHRLITQGPYSIIRHPIYVALGLFMCVLGSALVPPWSVAAACVPYAIGTIIRARAEDQLMAATFGNEFEIYRREVPGLIPRFRRRRLPRLRTER